MKTFYSAILAAVLSFSQFQTVSADTVEQRDVMIIDFINVKDLTSEMLMQIMTGQCANLAIEFSAGDQFPLNLFFDGDIASLIQTEESGLSLQLNRTIFLRAGSEGLLFSSDLNCWRSFREFITGQLQLGIYPQEEGDPVISISAMVNEKED